MRFENSAKLVERIRTEGNTGRKRVRAGILAVALGVTVTVVASTPSTPNGKPDSADNSTHPSNGAAKPIQKASVTKHWYEIGRASWYGGSFNGRKTANGERYDMTAWTCAHRTLPLGSWVKVTNLHNRRSIFLRVNDRGPVPESTIVDLSYAAAHKLGIAGVGKVRVETVSANDPQVIDQLIASVKPDTSIPWPVHDGLALER